MTKIILLLLLAVTSDPDISTSDSLMLSQGVYASILFTASTPALPNSPDPVKVGFAVSGDIPPGMIFERYPCNKPDMIACPAIARTDGVYLDGVPTQSGSFPITITATYEQQEVVKQFTVTIKGQ